MQRNSCVYKAVVVLATTHLEGLKQVLFVCSSDSILKGHLFPDTTNIYRFQYALSLCQHSPNYTTDVNSCRQHGTEINGSVPH